MARGLGAAIAGVCLALLSQGAAQAAHIKVTYKGVVSYGTDATRFFGAAQDLTGASFTSSYRFDTTRGVYSDNRGLLVPGTGEWNLEQLLGGSFAGSSSPLLASSIRINGVKASVDHARLAYHENGFEPIPTPMILTGADSFEALSPDFVIHDFINNFIVFPSAGYPDPSLVPPLIFDQAHAGDFQYGGGFFSFYAGSSVSGSIGALPFFRQDEESFNAPAAYAYGALSTRSMSVRVLSDVPEPSSWALLLLGLASLGVAARRRRAERLA